MDKNNPDIIVIGGKKYRLVPLQEENAISEKISSLASIATNQVEEKPQPSSKGIDNTINGSEEMKEARPVVSDYRDRYLKRSLLPSDIRIRDTSVQKIPEPNGQEMKDVARRAGQSDTWFGAGVEIDY